MATYKKGPNGALSGKVGNVINSSWRGISYIRSRPAPSSKPKTEKQLAQQAKFGFAVKFLSPVKSLVNIGFNRPKRVATAFNAAIKLTLQHVIMGEYPDYKIDFTKVRFSSGGLGQPVSIKLFPGAASLTIIWHGDGFQSNACGDDQVQIIIYEPANNAFLIGPSNVKRMQEACIMAIPNEFSGKTLHTYLFCISTCGRVSDTAYGGEVIVS